MLVESCLVGACSQATPTSVSLPLEKKKEKEESLRIIRLLADERLMEDNEGKTKLTQVISS